MRSRSRLRSASKQVDEEAELTGLGETYLENLGERLSRIEHTVSSRSIRHGYVITCSSGSDVGVKHDVSIGQNNDLELQSIEALTRIIGQSCGNCKYACVCT